MPSVLPNFLLRDVQAWLLPAAPLVVAAAVASYAVARRLGVDRRAAAVRATAAGVLAVHLAAVAVATRLVEVVSGGDDEFATRQLELVPLTGIGAYLQSDVSLTVLLQIGGNVALLLPLGVLIPLVVGRDPGWRMVLLLGTATSAAIEAVQWWFALGVASIDDVALNVTGVALGYLAYRWLIRVLHRSAEPSWR
jgi:glycopeptide antibiotics resistance protein